MLMSMFYVKGTAKNTDYHINFPAPNARAAYDWFKQEMGDKVTVVEITPLFDFDYEEKPLVTN